MFGLDPTLTSLLILCIIAVCTFEFANGFHDTANAVATVIYTKSLKPMEAVMLSGALNFLGVLTGGVAVAMGIVKLLPLEALVDQTVYQTVGMILAMLLTAILWNIGTWYYGIPCSSSHTLLASILGVTLAFSFTPEAGGATMDWGKAGEIGLSLLISPLVGFLFTLGLMFTLKVFVKDKAIFKEPNPKKKTPTWIRSILIFTCSGVSFSHGSNDGQKGVGLMMLVLIALAPAYFALNSDLDVDTIRHETNKAQAYLQLMDSTKFKSDDEEKYTKGAGAFAKIEKIFAKADSAKKELSTKDKVLIRKQIMTISKNFDKLKEAGYDKEFTIVIAAKKPGKDYSAFEKHIKNMKKHTDYVPDWALVLISLCLGLGTTVGWKRIVVTLGEKIGKQHLTYAQGASAELSAAATIAFSTYVMKLPVSTTQILSSGIAGAMVGSKGVGNLQTGTLKSIALAWVLTFPVCVLLSGSLFFLFRLIL
jgi:PiT family inorganic phosphate transporter